MTREQPVRRGKGPVHLAVPTGRGYRTACRRTLTGERVEISRRGWWFGRRCDHCEDLAQRATSSRVLARMAGW